MCINAGASFFILLHAADLYRVGFAFSEHANKLGVLHSHDRELDIAQGPRLTNKADSRVLHGLLVLGIHNLVFTHLVKDTLPNCAIGAIGPHDDIADKGVAVVFQNSDETVAGRDREDLNTIKDFIRGDTAKKDTVEDRLRKDISNDAVPKDIRRGNDRGTWRMLGGHIGDCRSEHIPAKVKNSYSLAASV